MVVGFVRERADRPRDNSGELGVLESISTMETSSENQTRRVKDLRSTDPKRPHQVILTMLIYGYLSTNDLNTAIS